MSNKNELHNKIIVALIGAFAMIFSAIITSRCNEQTPPPSSTLTPVATTIVPTDEHNTTQNPTNEAKTTVEPIVEMINIMDMEPISGYSNFWSDYYTGYEDNLGNSDYSGSIFCQKTEFDNSIIYPTDGKYTILSGDLALAGISSNIDCLIWIEFYSKEKIIGRTEKFTKGSRPITFSINISGVTDLRIKPKSSNELHEGYLLTHGFFLN